MVGRLTKASQEKKKEKRKKPLKGIQRTCWELGRVGKLEHKNFNGRVE